MRIVVTGSPGAGKTSLAKALGRKLKCRVLNEKDFALEKGIGKWDKKAEELVIPLHEFAVALNELLEKEKNIIVEGHLLCELKLRADLAILVKVEPEELEQRLRKRGYGEEKVQDNVFCEANDYCKKHLERNFPAEKMLEVQSGRNLKETLDKVIKGLKEKSL